MYFLYYFCKNYFCSTEYLIEIRCICICLLNRKFCVCQGEKSWNILENPTWTHFSLTSIHRTNPRAWEMRTFSFLLCKPFDAKGCQKPTPVITRPFSKEVKRSSKDVKKYKGAAAKTKAWHMSAAGANKNFFLCLEAFWKNFSVDFFSFFMNKKTISTCILSVKFKVCWSLFMALQSRSGFLFFSSSFHSWWASWSASSAWCSAVTWGRRSWPAWL